MEAEAYISESTKKNNSDLPTQHENEVVFDSGNDMAQDFEVPVIYEEYQHFGSPVPGVEVAATVGDDDETSRWILVQPVFLLEKVSAPLKNRDEIK